MPVQHLDTVGDEAGQHRGSQTHKSDGSGQGHRDAGQHHGADDGDEAGGADRDTQCCGLIIAKFQNIEPPAQQESYAQDHNDDWGGPDRGIKVELGQRAAAPCEQARGVFLEQDQQHGRRSIQGHSRGRTSQDEPGGAIAGAVAGQTQD